MIEHLLIAGLMLCLAVAAYGLWRAEKSIGRQTGGVIRNRSIFTGATRDIRLGPSARWFCDLEFVPTNSVTALNLARDHYRSNAAFWWPKAARMVDALLGWIEQVRK